MKITFLTPHLRIAGGVRILLMYATLLAEREHDVRIYVRSGNRIRRTIANIFQVGTPDWIDDMHGAKVIRVEDFTEEALWDADVLVSTTFDNTLKTEALSERKGKKVYLLQHDEGLYHGDRTLADRAYQTPATKIVVSSWLNEVLRERAHTEGVLLLNPIDHTQFYEVPGIRTKGSEVWVLLLSHTYAWKGTAEGAEIINRLRKKYPYVRLAVFGVREKTPPSFQHDAYYFNPPQEKLREIYSRAHIYLCPSWDEGFGLPSIEAMQCGAALVTYDNGGSKDFAFHEKTALVAKRRDVHDLELQLERAITDVPLRESIAREGKAFVGALPEWSTQVTKFEAIISNVLK